MHLRKKETLCLNWTHGIFSQRPTSGFGPRMRMMVMMMTMTTSTSNLIPTGNLGTFFCKKPSFSSGERPSLPPKMSQVGSGTCGTSRPFFLWFCGRKVLKGLGDAFQEPHGSDNNQYWKNRLKKWPVFFSVIAGGKVSSVRSTQPPKNAPFNVESILGYPPSQK